jgi:hypothetical protein
MVEEEWMEEETRWSRRRYRKSEKNGKEIKHIEFTSKFMTGEATITFDEISREWEGWSSIERNDFLLGYMRSMTRNTEEDFKIIEFLMEHAGQSEISMLPLLMRNLPNKKKVLDFLLNQVRETKLEEIENKTKCQLTNFYSAIEDLGDPDAIPVLKEKISEMLENPGLYEKGTPSQFNRVAQDLVTALKALYKMEPKNEYIKLLEGLKLHPSELVSLIAAKALNALKRI